MKYKMCHRFIVTSYMMDQRIHTFIYIFLHRDAIEIFIDSTDACEGKNCQKMCAHEHCKGVLDSFSSFNKRT